MKWKYVCFKSLISSPSFVLPKVRLGVKSTYFLHLKVKRIFHAKWNGAKKKTHLPRCFFFLICFLIGGKLLYNIVLVSVVQQCKPIIIYTHTHIFPFPVEPPTPPPHPTPLGHHTAPGWAPCVI